MLFTSVDGDGECYSRVALAMTEKADTSVG